MRTMRRRRGGLTAEQVGIAAILTVLLILAMALHDGSKRTGQSWGEQLYEVLLAEKDWE